MCGIQNITVEQWLGGETKAPLRKPINSLENKWCSLDESSKISRSCVSRQISMSPEKTKNNDDVYKSLIKFERKVINLNKEVESLKIKVKDDMEIIELLSSKVIF